MTFAFQVMTKRWAIPILDVFLFFRKICILSIWQLVAGPFSQVYVDPCSFFNNFMTVGKVLGAGMFFHLSSIGISRQVR